MEKAIKKAIEGGYDTIEWTSIFPLEEAIEIMANHWEVQTSRPLFWQALGKAMGWKYWVCEKCGEDISYRGSGPTNSIPVAQCLTHNDTERVYGWLYHWHRFIDHIAEGKSPDSFFESLIT